MPWTCEYNPKSGFIETIYEGQLTDDDLEAEDVYSIQLAIKNKTRMFLVDLTKYQGNITASGIYEIPGRYDERMTRPAFFAVIEPEIRDFDADVHFYRTVCTNRGWTVEVFKSKDAAIEWLNEQAKLLSAIRK